MIKYSSSFSSAIIVYCTQSWELTHCEDVFSEALLLRGLKRYFYRSQSKLQRQVQPEDTFSIALDVFQPQGLTPKPLTRWTRGLFLRRRYSHSVLVNGQLFQFKASYIFVLCSPLSRNSVGILLYIV